MKKEATKQLDKEHIELCEIRQKTGMSQINLIIENSLHPSKDKE
jgi:hypothetical protein